MDIPKSASKPMVISAEAVAKIDLHTDAISDGITGEYFERHPECRGASEVRIKRICREDMAHHLSFLRNAMATGVAEIFSEYTSWLKSVLVSRGLDTKHTKDALMSLQNRIGEILEGEDRAQTLDILNQAIESYDAAGDHSILTYTSPNYTVSVQEEKFYHALINNDRTGAWDVINNELDNKQSYADVSVSIIQSSLYEVGRQWQINQLTVAQEHLSTAISQNILTKTYSRSEFKPQNGKEAVFACLQGNHHSLGLRMVSDAFEIEGWDVNYLGADTPVDSLISLLDKKKVDLIGLSISLHDHVNSLSHALEKIKAELGNQCPAIAVGGLPLNSIPGLAIQLKADTWFPDAKVAVKEAG